LNFISRNWTNLCLQFLGVFQWEVCTQTLIFPFWPGVFFNIILFSFHFNHFPLFQFKLLIFNLLFHLFTLLLLLDSAMLFLYFIILYLLYGIEENCICRNSSINQTKIWIESLFGWKQKHENFSIKIERMKKRWMKE
jgi:hypothetical protein